ncbi:hypothetical protein N5B55_02975 [Ralstonia pickettii]|uniref:hypothetical protein n=1 Tax=Ralstonia pickettii TaxID=329 RepID=UPI002714D14D|nr:hypothetical protein [Ralstonia pickettii]WKZ85936.1 hypothetical protein N5B55_02975 [Ralstonia pickettii]
MATVSRPRWRISHMLVANRRRCVLTGLAVAVSLYFVARSAVGMYELDVPQLALGLVAGVLGAGFVHVLKALSGGRALAVLALHGLCGLLLASMMPPVMDAYPTVEVVATGEHNPHAGGTEIWLPDVTPGRIYFEGPGWERRDNAVSVSYKDQPNRAVLRGKWRDGDVLRLAMHPYSGIAIVRMGTTEQRVDLFAEAQSVMAMDLPHPMSSTAGKMRRVLYGLIPLMALLSLGALLVSLPSRWQVVTTASVLLGTLTGIGVAGRSYPGTLELLAYGTGSVARLEVDAGSGPFALPLKEGAGGPSVELSAERGKGEAVYLRPESGYLRPVRPFDGVGKRGQDEVLSAGGNVCAEGEGLQVFRHVASDGQGIRVRIGITEGALVAPSDAAHGQVDGYVVAQCHANSVSVSYSRAFIRISPWEFPHSLIRSVRAQDTRGRELALLQLSVDSPVGYAPASELGRSHALLEINRRDTQAFFLQKIIAACLVGVLPFLALIAVGNFEVACRNWQHGSRHLVTWLYTAPMAWVLLTLVIQWPGTVGWDAYSPFIQAQTGTITLWYGIGYPMIVGALFLLMPPPLIGVWQCVIAALLIQWVTVRCVESGVAARRVGALACLLMPLTIVPFGATVHLRDAMNGVLVAAFGVLWAAGVLRHKARGDSATLPYRTVLGLLAVCLVLLRIDNIAFLAVIFIASPLLSSSGRRLVIVYSAITLVVTLLANPAAERVIFGKAGYPEGERNKYAEASLVGPLVGFLTNPDSQLSPAERGQIENDLSGLMDVRRAIDNWSVFHVIWWHQDQEGRQLPPAEAIRMLKKDLFRGALGDPLRFVEMRSAIFLSTLGHRWIPVRQSPAHAPESYGKFSDRVWMKDTDTVVMNDLLGFTLETREFKMASRAILDFYGRYATTLPQFLLCVLLVGLIRVVPIAGVIALALLARAGVFFLLAPADVFLYLYDMHFLGFLLLPIAVCEWARQRRKDSVQEPPRARPEWKEAVPSK